MRGVALQDPGWEPACMEPDELELYRAGRALGCKDCTADFAASMTAIGRCNGIPGEVAGPIITTLEQLGEALPVPRKPTPFIGGTTRVSVARKEAPVEPQPTRITALQPARNVPESDRAKALRELADASEVAREAQVAFDRAASAKVDADSRLEAAIRMATGKKPKELPAPGAIASTSTNGAAPELTELQRKAIAAVIEHKGSRGAAEALGITNYQTIEGHCEAAARKGLLPVEALPFLPARFQAMARNVTPTESATRDESTG